MQMNLTAGVLTSGRTAEDMTVDVIEKDRPDTDSAAEKAAGVKLVQQSTGVFRVEPVDASGDDSGEEVLVLTVSRDFALRHRKAG